MRPGVPDIKFSDAGDADIAAYRPLAGQAVLGLLFAVASPLALLDLWAWTFPVLGGFFGIWALRRIRKTGGAMTGRGLALAALAVSLLMAGAAPTDWLLYRTKLRAEAREFSNQWFRYISQEEPQCAYQLTIPPAMRAPRDQDLWNFYRNAPRVRQMLESYVASPLVRTLLALGPKSQVRFYQTAAIATGAERPAVEQWYAVTYEDNGDKKSFIVALAMERWQLSDGTAAWQVSNTQVVPLAKPSK